MAKKPQPPKIYTRTGDKGTTSLIGGARVEKSDLRLEVYGTVDELNSFIGLLLAQLTKEFNGRTEVAETQSHLQRIQSDLFDLGTQLACEEEALRAKLPHLHDDHLQDLELAMDTYTEHLKPLQNFILPGGSVSAATAHVARTVCRRAERLCVKLSLDHDVEALLIRYLNRLSDYLFVLARFLNACLSIEEPIWSARKK